MLFFLSLIIKIIFYYLFCVLYFDKINLRRKKMASLHNFLFKPENKQDNLLICNQSITSAHKPLKPTILGTVYFKNDKAVVRFNNDTEIDSKTSFALSQFLDSLIDYGYG